MLYFDLSVGTRYICISSFNCAAKMLFKIGFVLLLGFSASSANPPDDASVECPNIISRSQWTISPVGEINYLILPIPYVVIQHTVTPECETREQCEEKVENIRGYHMDTLGWDDIGYSFLVGGDGNIYEGCGWTREGAHTYGYNKKSIGIAFIGNFSNKRAKENMLNAVHQLIQCGKSQDILRSDVRVIGGRQATATSSPGKKLFEQIQSWPEWVSNP